MTLPMEAERVRYTPKIDIQHDNDIHSKVLVLYTIFAQS
jgi:hypothetical protein